MKNILKYKGYSAKIEFNAADQLFFGYVLGLPKAVNLTFDSDNVTGLIHDFHNVIDDYLIDCREQGIDPVCIASGRILLRIEPDTHAAAILAARSENKSLNTFINDTLLNALGM